MNLEQTEFVTQQLKSLKGNYKNQFDSDVAFEMGRVLSDLFRTIGAVRTKAAVRACTAVEEFLSEAALRRHIPEPENRTSERCSLCEPDGFIVGSSMTSTARVVAKCNHDGKPFRRRFPDKPEGDIFVFNAEVGR